MSNPFCKAKPSGVSASVVFVLNSFFSSGCWYFSPSSRSWCFIVFCVFCLFNFMSLPQFALTSLTHKQNIPSAERRGGGWPARSTTGPAVSASPSGSCWRRRYSGQGSQTPWGEKAEGGGQWALACGVLGKKIYPLKPVPDSGPPPHRGFEGK